MADYTDGLNDCLVMPGGVPGPGHDSGDGSVSIAITITLITVSSVPQPSAILLVCRADRQVAPASRPLDAHGDHRVGCDLHRGELRIARAQQRLSVLVLLPFAQDFGAPVQHDPAEPRPIPLVAVDNDGDGGILGNVLEPL